MKNFFAGRKLGLYNYLGIVAVIAVALLGYYIFLPPINVFAGEFWIYAGSIAVGIIGVSFRSQPTRNISQTSIQPTKLTKVMAVIVGITVIVLIFGSISSSTLFNAKKYASLLTIEEREFAEDIEETDTISDIALMDTEAAAVIGERAIGSLANVVSQYEISDEYNTIDLNGEPMKAASLEYAYGDFFKWLNNRGNGIPGYVIVNPVTSDTKYVELDNSIKYTSSGWFNDNLYRHLRFQYPTAIFEGCYFELDNDGNPYYVCPIMKPRVGMFGAYDVSAVVLCDPCTGKSEYYELDEVPNWVDHVYDGSLVQQKYDWYGRFSGGFWNSVIGQTGCKVTTEDFGYKVMEGDVWVYTGVTSVNGDESNIGFVMINSRTCQTKYYQVAGAEEFSAMSAAEGEVQHLGYDAAFPSLVNIGGEPTYVMILKDKSNLVKMYAMVNVEKYNVVATGTTQRETLANYKKLLKENGISAEIEYTPDDYPSKQITVDNIRYINTEDATFVYITDKDGVVYKEDFAEDESLIFINEGDTITIYYEESEDGINELVAYEKI
ncbi:MAG: hypothetical protein ACI4DS_05045 [Eubacterium sp.]